ncbi:MAG: hypothetical protein AAB482_02250 [Patescibacteria group bacterium]
MEYIQNVGSVTPRPSGGKSAKNIAVVIVLLIGVLAVAGVAYWKFADYSIDTDSEYRPDNPSINPSIKNEQTSSSAANDTSSAIDAELNAMGEVGTIDNQFTDVDQAQKGL